MVTQFTTEQLATLTSQYGSLKTFHAGYLGQMRHLLGACEPAALQQLVDANIKFVSKLARNEQYRRRPAVPAQTRQCNFGECGQRRCTGCGVTVIA